MECATHLDKEVKPMGKKPLKKDVFSSPPLDISDDDILEAMRDIRGYLDITPGDFKDLYRFAYNHAIERLTKLAKAGDMMTSQVVFVRQKTPLKAVAETMSSHGISGVPVVDDEDKVVGVISEKDFLSLMDTKKTESFMGVVAQCLTNKGCVAKPMRKQNAEDIMTSPAITVGENTSIAEIVDILRERNINRVPVIDQQDKLIGIVSRQDVVQASVSEISK
jgi:CBS domain-containing protein